jgi:hypothetical protein
MVLVEPRRPIEQRRKPLARRLVLASDEEGAEKAARPQPCENVLTLELHDSARIVESGTAAARKSHRCVSEAPSLRVAPCGTHPGSRRVTPRRVRSRRVNSLVSRLCRASEPRPGRPPGARPRARRAFCIVDARAGNAAFHPKCREGGRDQVETGADHAPTRVETRVFGDGLALRRRAACHAPKPIPRGTALLRSSGEQYGVAGALCAASALPLAGVSVKRPIRLACASMAAAYRVLGERSGRALRRWTGRFLARGRRFGARRLRHLARPSAVQRSEGAP